MHVSCVSRWILYHEVFPGGIVVTNLSANTGDSRNTDSIPELGRSPGVGNGNPLQCLYLENPMDGGAWRPPVLGVTMSQT